MHKLRFEKYEDGSGWQVEYGDYESVISNWRRKSGIKELRRLANWFNKIADKIEKQRTDHLSKQG